ncbi:Protein-L-isoaspartate O-methyltransferase [Rubrobacter xylanophilus DSM 9941]|uniref:protein-L-isoaspartate(D-aspartate) O-methyltransferase n=1 Tax=Rubrobacter xylanophilus TaxID=49319 RepID=UPI001C63BBEA|nr:protein-L-isoaspartate(D-aspartate) O-methyltransferase [Rubrobacter xylanophilus]QYJ14426.1 Protein-L-isoaspartate O-methyltransferase [Rubrobacter xylanophilus DSM 9941]
MPGSPEDLVRAATAAGVRDRRVLEALRRVPRELFVPPEHAGEAYLDRPLPIPHEQVTTQPSLVARMVEALGLEGGEKVLEVGTGYGFQTALLALLCTFVCSVERYPDVAETARRNLSRCGISNVRVVVGDGTRGLPEEAPFDAILVSAAFPRVPEPLASQLAPSGRLVQPVGPGGEEEVVLFGKSRDGELVRRAGIADARFVRLYGDYGFEPPP